MHRDNSKDPWGPASIRPPPFDETRLLGLTEESLPVHPLRPPLERALLLAVLAVGLGALVLLATSLRTDLGKVPWVVAYGPALLELVAGAVSVGVSVASLNVIPVLLTVVAELPALSVTSMDTV